MRDRVLVGMSGGLDSSVAAMLLKEQGYEVTGIFLHLWKGNHPRSCCSREASLRASETAEMLGIPLYVIGGQERFQKAVVSFFKEGYEGGRTPNPCIECNRHIKFSLIAEQLSALGAKWMATGHYARLERTRDQIFLRRARDAHKDQSYFLYSVPPDILKILLLPLGEWTKEEVRAYARKAGLPSASAPESMDLCFFQHDANGFFGSRKVEFVDPSGKVLGEAVRPMFFSVGQRKGLGIASGEALFVRDVDGRKGRVTLVPRTALDARGVELEKVTWVAPPRQHAFTAQGQHRSSAEPVNIRFYPGGGAPLSAPSDTDRILSSERAFVEFESPVWAPAPGQSLVVYEGDRVVCGGIMTQIVWDNP
ncbi:MAG: tRNA 2-thiouridine(34) synthase MnmA [bacterium JZ-2024 1]